MASPISTKFEGNIGLVVPHQPRAVDIGTYPAVIHLFEHEYDTETKFWYGVAEVVCTLKEIHDASQKAGLPHASGSLNIPKFKLRIELPDGRFGIALELNAMFDMDWESDHTKIAFFGETPLTPKRA
jgi:hypothetical protein